MFFNKFMPYTPFTRKMIHSAVDWLLPRTCILCGTLTSHIHSFCNACQKDLPILPQSCQQCAQFLRFPVTNPLKCGNCLSFPPNFDRIYTLFPYEPPVDSLITRLKFHHQISHARSLGEFMLERIQTDWYCDQPLPDLIIPIPLHAKRLAERGFNQALEIARPIARALHIPIDYQGIQRIKPTLAQSGLSREARKHNVAQAFSVVKNYQGLRLALLDDVITTGFTVNECSRLLRKHGATVIHAWCCARNG